MLKFFRVHFFLVFAMFVCSCAPGPKTGSVIGDDSDRDRVEQFYNLTHPMGLRIREGENGVLSWVAGIDAYGTVVTCPESSEFFCLILDEQWLYAVPRTYLRKPAKLGSWVYQSREFLIDSIIRIPYRDGYEEAMLISSYAPESKNRGTIFIHGFQSGLRYVLFVEIECDQFSNPCINNLPVGKIYNIWASKGYR